MRWTRQQLRLSNVIGEEFAVSGLAAGRFGVHFDRLGANGHARCCGKWCLSHLPTGALIRCFRSRQEACAFADLIAELCDWEYGSFGENRNTVGLRRSKKWKVASDAIKGHLPSCILGEAH